MDPQTKPGAPAAVDVEAGVRPGENALGPFRAQQRLADKHRQNLAAEDLGQPRVVDPRDLMENARLVGPTLGHQKMEVHVKIDPVPKGLDGGDDSGRKRAPGHNLEVTAQGPEGAAAEIAEETAIDTSKRSVSRIHSPHSSIRLA